MLIASIKKISIGWFSLIFAFAVSTRIRENLLYLIQTTPSQVRIATVTSLAAGLHEVMPAEVLEVMEIMKRFNLSAISVSSDFYREPGVDYNFSLEQRLVEGLWPKHLTKHSRHRMLKKTSQTPHDCKTMFRGSLVHYAICN